MRKAICLLVIVLIAIASTASADSIDWSLYSSEDLTIMREDIDRELSKRTAEEGDIPRWFDYGMGAYAPDPNILFEREVSYENNVFGNTPTMLIADIDDSSTEEFNKYVDAIIQCGFVDVIERSSNWYEARNAEGITARIVYIGDLNITISMF